MFDIGNVWDFDLRWDTFAYVLKIVAPFLMIIIAILGVGALLYMVVVAVKKAVEK
ncbi:PTS ascorbate transporter subunit IIC [Lysinibacillus sp. D4B2_S17]|uniref:PTS ascorbate transporter subunit IIC n=1 Tax=Lysinibacillus sp. D4B2_S17 TaxID=2941225 RepID=UPI0020BF1E59|nr:PTS ascorbate transporter subunit IIC [Lysinibacillus sp. D4B2_S17]